MKKLKLHHKTKKLENIDCEKPVILLSVYESQPINSDLTIEDFKYLNKNHGKDFSKFTGKWRYNGNYLILVFVDDKGNLFIVNTSASSEQKENYLKIDGRFYEIEFKKKEKEIHKIKFYFRYEKLKNIECNEPVILLEVFEKTRNEMGKEFIDYDTLYKNNGIDEFYKIPDGEYLVLLFRDTYGVIFTTIRNINKKEYYLKNKGKKFAIEFF